MSDTFSPVDWKQRAHSWLHVCLVATWNCPLRLEFLPGSPGLFECLMVPCLFLAGVEVLIKERRARWVYPGVSKSLLALLAVIFITFVFRGGVGFKILGGHTYGGGRYVLLLGAIAGYFVLSSVAVPTGRVALYVALFFLPRLLAVGANLIPALGGWAHGLFAIFPRAFATEQLLAIAGVIDPIFARWGGLRVAGLGVLCCLLARYGLRGIFVKQLRWRVLFFLIAFGAIVQSGYRSTVILILLTMVGVDYLESRRWKPIVPRYALLLLGLSLFGPMLPVDSQRSLSFLPEIKMSRILVVPSPSAGKAMEVIGTGTTEAINRSVAEVEPVESVKRSARGGIDWRVDIWRDASREALGSLVIGRGFAIPGDQLDALRDEQARNIPGSDQAMAVLSGDYHSGPLSLFIPLGGLGVVAFLWFVYESFRALHANCPPSKSEGRFVDICLLSHFVALFVCFVAIFGGFYADLATFTGLVGLSACFARGRATSGSTSESAVSR